MLRDWKTGSTQVESEWKKVLGNYPDQARAVLRTKLAKVEYVYIPSERLGDANVDLLSIIADYPSMKQEVIDAKRLLAMKHYRQGQYDDAIAICDELLASSENTLTNRYKADLEYCKGLAYRNKNEVDSCIAAFSAALDYSSASTRYSLDADIRMNLAEAYGIKSDKARVVEHLDAVERNDKLLRSTRALALYKKATYLKNFGDKEGSRTAFQTVKERYQDTYLSITSDQQLADM